MQDFEAFQAATSSDNTYTSTLTHSLSLALDEFYRNLQSVGVSAVSGAGMDAFFKAVEASAEEYMENYKYFLNLIVFLLSEVLLLVSMFLGSLTYRTQKPDKIIKFHVCTVNICFSRADLDKRRAEKQRLEEERRRENMDKLRMDMEKSRGETVVLSTGLKDKDGKSRTLMEEEYEEGKEDDEDDYEALSEEEDYIDEDDNDEDEEVAKFSFQKLQTKICV